MVFGRWHIWGVVFVAVLGLMTLTASLMQGLRLDSVATLVVLVCGWVGLVWLLKSLWTPVLLFTVCLPSGLGIPLPFLWKIELFALLLITITGIEIWEVLVRGGGSGRQVFGRHWPILLAIALFIGRTIVDMPGSAQMGRLTGIC